MPLTLQKGTIRGSIVELLATALFVYVGTGSAVSTGELLARNDDQALVARLMPIAMAFGIAIVVLVYAFGHISGGHINPAVTLMLMLINACDPIRGILYMICQLIGAVLGSLLLWASTNSLTASELENVTGTAMNQRISRPPFGLGNNFLNSDLSVGNGFMFEFMGTLLLCLTVCFTVKQNSSLSAGNPTMAPLAIGFAVFLAHLVLVPFTGCGINPARSFGPAVVNSFAGNNVWANNWIFYVGPFTASVVSAAIYLGITYEERHATLMKGATSSEGLTKDSESAKSQDNLAKS